MAIFRTWQIGWFPETKVLFLQTSLFCIVVELVGGGFVVMALAVTVSATVAVAVTIAVSVAVSGALNVCFIVPPRNHESVVEGKPSANKSCRLLARGETPVLMDALPSFNQNIAPC